MNSQHIGVSDRIGLRPLAAHDVPWMATMDVDKELVGEHNWGGESRDRQALERKYREGLELDGLCSAENGTLLVELDRSTRIGSVSWRTMQWGPSQKSKCPVFGVALLPPYRGQGFGTAAQILLIDYLFANTNAHRVQSDTAVDNTAEAAVLRKIGMVEEGILRDAEFRDGRYFDHLLFSALRTEWVSS